MVLRRVFLSAVLGFFTLPLAPGFAATVYVAADAPGPVHDGASWATAFGTVAGGLSAAQDGDEVWVAKGAYPENITLPAGVALYGGFTGTETQRGERDWAANATVLTGGGAWVVTVAKDAAGPIDGFTIRNSGGAGGGILVDDANVAIRNNLIRDNIRAGSQGGGIRCLNASPVIEGNTFINNIAPVGGAIFSNTASPRIVGNRFLHNKATSFSGSGNEGGAIYNGSRQSGGPGALIAGNLFLGNQAEGSASGLYPRGGAMVTRSGRTVGNVFVANTVGFANDAGNGGAVYAYDDAEVTNNVFTSNSALRGGAISMSGTVTVAHNTIVMNGSRYATVDVLGDSPRLVNNLIAFNGAGVTVATGATPVLRHNNVFGNTGSAYSGITDPTGTDGNIAADPRLASLEYGDLHIQPDSPCMDAGDNAFVVEGDTDMDGQPRIQGAAVDIGADESDGTIWSGVARIVRVSPNGDDASDGSTWATAMRTISAAMDALAPGGGEVWVAAGTYLENLRLRTSIHLYGGFAGTEEARGDRGPAGPPSVLASPGSGIAVTVQDVVYGTLDGFTIRGRVNRGVWISGSNIRVVHNIITGTGNPSSSDQEQAGIFIESGAPAILNNRIVGNQRIGILSRYYSEPRIEGNVVAENQTGLVHSGKGTVTNNTIVRNEQTGVYILGASSNLTFSNNIVAYNQYLGLYLWGNASPEELLHFRNNCIFGNGGSSYGDAPDLIGRNGNIAADPMLAGLGSGNVHIQPDSPCVDAGDSSVVQPGATDIDGQSRIQGAAVDIGADESDGTVWSTVPRIVRVHPTGDDANDGSGWGGAKRTVQSALDDLALTGGEVWVAEGVYDECVTLPAYTRLYGGFGGTEAERAQRDWAAHPTVLDGGLRASVVTIPVGSPETVVDGFTIRNGQGVRGGGIHAGSRFYEIAHNTIIGNRATGSFETINGVVVITTGIGGGVYAPNPGHIHDNVIRDNTAKDTGAGVYMAMGAVLESTDPVSSRFTNNTIVGNRNDTQTIGGALRLLGGSDPYYAILLANNIIAHNTGGVYGPVTVTMRNNILFGNGADYDTIPDQTGLNGNLKADPRFVDLDAGDLHIRPDSPCRDAGDGSAVEPGSRDIDGQPRLYDVAVDIGADEVPPSPALMSVLKALRIGGGLEPAPADTAAPFDLLKAVEMARQATGLRLE